MRSIAPAELGGQKSKLSYRHSELGAIKIFKKLGMFRPAHRSLYILCSQEREREKFIPLFSFSLLHYDIISFELPGHFALEKNLRAVFIMPISYVCAV